MAARAAVLASFTRASRTARAMGSISGGRSGIGGRLLGGLPMRVLAIAPLEQVAAVVDAAVGADADVPVRAV
jgi:hypothetical protein